MGSGSSLLPNATCYNGGNLNGQFDATCFKSGNPPNAVAPQVGRPFLCDCPPQRSGSSLLPNSTHFKPPRTCQ